MDHGSAGSRADSDDVLLAGRYRIEGMLGEGGMGVVYEAWDEQRGSLVALKTLVRLSPTLIYQFKQEFRALSDVAHPNLVTLYDLVHAEGVWLLAMELVRGKDFVNFVRNDQSSRLLPTHTPSALIAAGQAPTLHAGDLLAAPLRERPAHAPSVDGPRLRETLAELTRGLGALHAARKLHRDVKPSNVLCTAEGRAVLVDFGLVAELPREQSERAQTKVPLAGTPAYMAPELFAGERASPASDWYAVGAMLYEALTGLPPLMDQSSSWEEFMQLRRDCDPPAPQEVAPEVDPELAELCVGLLARNPAERPAGDDVLGLLSGPRSRAFFLHQSGFPRGQGALVGREQELAVLRSALGESRSHAVALHVRGPSGMGKSHVIRAFLDELRQAGSALVLEGRCYEREYVAYKGLDSSIDALSTTLCELEPERVERLLPPNVQALARVFPVLKRVPAILRASRAWTDAADPSEQRRQAFGALRELLARLAREEPVVLWIDDLQWSDADSLSLLAEVLSPPEAPRLLVIWSYRSDAGVDEQELRSYATGPLHELEIGPLSETQARELALSLLGGSDPAHAALIARESRGNPLFVHELVRLSSTLTTRAAGEATSLDDLIAARVERLPVAARNLLELVAVAGRPIDVSVLRRAITADDLTISTLRAASMLRLSPVGGGDGVESLHDRIRETVVSRLDAERLRDRHRRLARALEAGGSADAEALAEHWRAAEEPERALGHIIQAADRARAQLAFDRAQKLYRLALELTEADDPRRTELFASLGDVLASDGRCAEAADALLKASERARELDALELRRKAGEQLLISGHIDEGLDVLGSVLARARIRPPRSPALALAALLAGRAKLRLRGTGYVERDEASIDREQLTRIDLCWAASAGLGMVDNIRGAYFQTQHILLALECGEPYRVARALAMEVGYRATAGRRARQSAATLSREALALAERIGHPHTLGLATITAGMTSFLRGDWQAGYDLIARGESTLREHCRGVVSERTNAMLYMLRCLLYLGRLDEVCERLPPLMEEAEERGNLYAMTYLRLRYGYLPHLRNDDVQAARELVDSASRRWSKRGFHLQHYLDVFARAEIELYAELPARAQAVIDAHMPEIQRSLILRVQHLRIEMLHLRARTLLALARDADAPRERRRLCRQAEQIADALSREQVGWADALADLVRAGAALCRQRRTPALAHVARAATAFDASGMALHAAAARWLQGELDASGPEAASTQRFASEGIVNPRRWAAMLSG